jgi:5-(carboxyamino)imidazole ribonucleotide synthase
VTRIGCLGGGQLGRMLALAGYPMGLTFTFLEPAPNSSAGQVGAQLVGPYDDPELLARLGADSDLVTFEFESVPERSARAILSRSPVFPPPGALLIGQDRLLEKRLFERLGIPAAEFATVDAVGDLDGAIDRVGLPARLKTRRLGYDGHGQVRITERVEAELAWNKGGGQPSILEREVEFDRELSVLGVRSVTGEVAVYPLTQNHHQDSILRLSLAPAPGMGSDLQARAEEICGLILHELAFQGVLAVELFQLGGRLLANEIAPRVHNSGHWTMDGAATSQFENHLRAGLGWKLGSTAAIGHSAMVNLLGELPDPARVLAVAGAHLHLYGKSPRPGRKLGHVNLTGADPVAVTAATIAVAEVVGAKLPPPADGTSYWPAPSP